MIYPCQRVLVSQVKKKDDTYTFHCKCVDLEMELKVENNKPFPVPAQVRVVKEICEKRCPAIKREDPNPAN